MNCDRAEEVNAAKQAALLIKMDDFILGGTKSV